MKKGLIASAGLGLLMMLIYTTNSTCQQLAFPTAEGFGKHATGGRGGVVYEVTNLNDSGEGSLREAIDANGARTVVFRVSGTIFLESPLRIRNGNITIAGQTAPGNGITLANYNFNVDADNVIVRYIRSRLGDNINQEDDAFTCRNTSDVIIDHCSFSWGIDEVASMYQNTNFTMQWCIVSESLYSSIHDKGNHGYGGIWGGSYASFHHNLIAHHSSRNPRFNGARYEANWDEHVDHRNNVIYNWGFNSAYAGEPSEIDGNKAKINVVKNYYKPGPATNDGQVKYRIVEPYAQGSYGYSYWHIDSNVVDGYPDVFDNNWELGVQQVSESEKDEMRSDTLFSFDIVTNQTAEDAFISVLENAGTVLPLRDTIDKRIVSEVLNGTATYGGIWGEATGIIDSQNDVGGWPELFSAHAPVDSDHDGMPDDWETSMGFNPGNPDDRNDDHNGNGYTNLEEYLNSITPFPEFIHPPTSLEASLSGSKSVNLTWKDNAYQESGMVIERSVDNGFIVIDTMEANTESYTDTTTQFSTTYNYRVKAISATDSSVYSNSIEVTTLSETPLPAITYAPIPEDGAEYAGFGGTLFWSGDELADTYKVYIGESNPPEYVNEVADTFFSPSLQPSTTYYWRVDAVNEHGASEGNTWTFTTRPLLDPQLIGRWDFESAFKAADSSQFENTGQYTGLGSSNFEFNAPDNSRTVHFDGDEKYVNVPYSFEFDFDKGSFSIAFWVKQSQYGLQVAANYPYFGKGYKASSGFSALNKGFEIAYNPADEELLFKLDDGFKTSELQVARDNYTTNEWKHLVALRDTLNKQLRLYIDGSLLTTVTDSTNDISGTDDLFIGNFSSTAGYMNWYLDDLRFYNFVLTENQINDIISNNSTHSQPESILSNYKTFPNPAKNQLNIQIHLQQQDNIKIRLFNLGGQVVAEQSMNNLPAGMHIINQNITNINSGIYILRIENSDLTTSKKIIIE